MKEEKGTRAPNEVGKEYKLEYHQDLEALLHYNVGTSGAFPLGGAWEK